MTNSRIKKVSIFGHLTGERLFLLSVLQRCLFVAFCLFAAQGAHAQAAADNTTSIEDLLKAATTAFNNGDYKTAATGLNSIITQAQNKTKLEPLYYMLGASQYNNNNFDDAATTFNSYITQYPTGEHMNDVLMALARCDEDPR